METSLSYNLFGHYSPFSPFSPSIMHNETIDPDPTQWHAGNLRMHKLMSVPPMENPNAPFLPQSRAFFLHACPLIAVGVLDKEGRPWTTLWGGERGFAASLGNSTVGMTSLVNRKWDPVIELLRDGKQNEELFGRGRKISALAIDLESRSRLKFAGEVLGTLFNENKGETRGKEDILAEAQLVLKVESSLGKSSIPTTNTRYCNNPEAY